MAEPYMYDYGPKWFFGYGLTRITINTFGEQKYPTPSGKVTNSLDEACKKLHGTRRTVSEILNLLKEQLIEANK